MKLNFIFIILFFFLVFFAGIVSAGTPSITWEPPTPNDGDTVNINSVYLNTTITDDNETSAFFDWDNSLGAYWAMDFYNITGVYDNSTYSNFGEFKNGLSTSNITTAKYGKGLDFDGTNDYIDFGNDASLNPGYRNFTISMWVKVTEASSSADGLLTKHYSNAYGVFYYGGLRLYIQSGGAYNEIVITSYHDQWINVVWTVDNAGNKQKSYLNGVFNVETTHPVGNVSSASNLNIGRYTSNGGGYFKGSVDEVKIWNRLLSPEEISASYNNSKYRLYHNFTSLSAGTYNYSAYAIDEDGNLNITKIRNITVAVSGPPTTPTPEINSTGGNDYDDQDLNCYDTITDSDGDAMNVTVKWYKDDVLNLTIDYNDSYANNYEFSAVLDSGNTTAGDVWKCGMRLYDGTDYSEWGNSSNLQIIDQDSPTITWELPTPLDSSSQSKTSVYLNTTIIDVSDTSAFFDWNYSLGAYWAMDFYNITGVYDNSTYSNFGEFKNGLSTSNITTAKYGKGVDFNGIDDYINCGNDTNLNPGYRNFTVSMWIKVHDKSGNQGVLTKDFTPAYGIFHTSGNDEIALYLDGNLHNGIVITSYYDQWIHVLWTVDNAGNKQYSYLNGVFNVQTNHTVGDMTSTCNLNIGRYASSENNYFRGSVDEVKIWNRLLSPEEIQASYDNSKYSLYHNFTSLSAGTYNYSAYAIDTGGNLNITETRKITISADTCTPPESGNWAISCSDNCVWNSDFTVPANITMASSGILTLNANMSFNGPHWEIYKEDGCDIIISSGGSIK